MTTKRLLPSALLLCLSLAAPAARAQDDLPSGRSALIGGITVTGHAEIQVKPDVAYVTLGVVTQARDQAEAVRANATRAQALMTILSKSGIVDKDIQTDNYSINPQYDYRTSPAVFTGYQVTNDLRVTIHALPKVGLIIDKAVRAGANQSNGVSFDLADKTKPQGEALVEAIADARRKADLMAGASGVTLGRLIALTEGAQSSALPISAPLDAPAAASPAPPTPIAPQQITVTEDVTAVYAITPAR